MRDLFYEELAKKVAEIKEQEKSEAPAVIEVYKEDVIQSIDQIQELSILGRKQGLLSLEEKAYNMNSPREKYLKNMVMLIVDGTDPELIEDLCWMKYYSRNMYGYSGLLYLIQMRGALDVQQGVNPVVIVETIKCMIPEELEENFLAYEERKTAEREEFFSKKPLEYPDIAAFCKTEFMWEIDEEGYDDMKEIDAIFRYMHNHSMQRFLREVDNADLILLLKELSGEARKKVFSNMSSRLAIMIYEDVQNLWYYDKRAVAECARKTYITIKQLTDWGECPELISYFQFDED